MIQKVVLMLSCVCGSYGSRNVRVRQAKPLERELQVFMVMDPMVNATAADPDHLYPLGRCQGDCDEDSHCISGLKCYQREPNITVPGCRGGEVDGTASDYCIRLEDFPEGLAMDAPSSSPSGNPSIAPWSIPSATPSVAPSSSSLSSFPSFSGPSTSPSSYPTTSQQVGELAVVSEPLSRPLALCEGDCDADDDCEEGLICWTRNAGDMPIPFCKGPIGTSRTDFCVPESAGTSESPSTAPTPEPTVSPYPSGTPTESTVPSLSPTQSKFPSTVPTQSSAPSVSTSPTTVLIPIVDFGGMPPMDKHPMALCEGDCDDDSDCVAGLVCRQRNAGDEIPGCQGDLSTNSDVCVKSNTLSPLIDFGDTPPDSFKPLRLCEGDCDDDSDCGRGLVCKHRDAGDNVPGCAGDFSTSADICVWP
jgi:hypothetical protein